MYCCPLCRPNGVGWLTWSSLVNSITSNCEGNTLLTLCNKKLVIVPPSRFYNWFWIFFHRWTRIRGSNFCPRLHSRVIRDSRIFPRFSAKCRFLKKVTNIFSRGLFRSTEWICKMILQKKKIQKVENSHFGNVLKFWYFFNFRTFYFHTFDFSGENVIVTEYT